MPARILIVDDETNVQRALARILGRMGHETATASDGAEAARLLGESAFDLCVTDLRMPVLDGFGVLRAARGRRPPVPVVVLTGHGSVPDAVRALREGACDFMAKPFHVTSFEDVVRRALQDPRTTVPGRRSAPGVALVTETAAMKRVLDRVQQIADTDASVLIRGETGTGKEVVARLIHASSSRRAGPFVAVNMAAVPEPLAEAELFGHVRGAFTGADRARTGRMASAHEGTLFLDEVGDMPRGLQAKLLRVLQDRQIPPVGSEKVTAVDVRVVAATHRDLEAMVKDGAFREDLFYRLHVIPIDVPPLRERREDIPALAEHFRAQVNAREGRSVPSFSPEVVQRLMAHSFPGNVRELENLIERLVVVASDRTVTLDNLPASLRTDVLDLQDGHLELPARGVDLRLLLTRLEERFIEHALERTGGNKNRAAELLGMNRTTLVEKLRRRNVA